MSTSEANVTAIIQEEAVDIDAIGQNNLQLIKDNEEIARSIYCLMQDIEDVKAENMRERERCVALHASYEKLKDDVYELLFNGLLERCRRFPYIHQGREKCVPEDYSVECEVLDKNLRGSTVAAVRKSDGKHVVVKRLTKNRIRRVGQLEKVDSEIRLLERLQHPGIAQLVDAWDTASDLNLAYERFGKDLFYVMDNFPNGMPPHLISQITESLLVVLGYIHSRDVAHCDIKPENVLVSIDLQNQCCLKLTDFELAIEVGDDYALPKGLRGSAGFTAPEMLGDRAYNPMKADIWSFGCILLELLLGHATFNKRWMSVYSRISTITSEEVICFNEDLKLAIEATSFQIEESSPFFELLLSTLETSPHLRASASEILERKQSKIRRRSFLGIRLPPAQTRCITRRRLEESITFDTDYHSDTMSDDGHIEDAVSRKCYDFG